MHVVKCCPGTLGFEALLSLLGVGPGIISTRHFAFETLPLSPQGTLTHVRKPHFHRHVRSIKACASGASIDSDDEDSDDSDGDSDGDGGEQGGVERQSQAVGRVLGALPEILFSDNNEDAICTVKNNIHAFCSRLNVSNSDSGNSNRDVDVVNSLVKCFHSPAKLNFLTASLHELLGSLEIQTANAAASAGGDSSDSVKDVRPMVALLLNPPYGQRLGKDTSASSNYRAIGKRVVEIRDHIASGGIGRGKGKGSKRNITPQLMGYILCPDQPTWSAFMLCLSQKKFGVKTSHFTHGGNDTRLVSFWDIA